LVAEKISGALAKRIGADALAVVLQRLKNAGASLQA
jgi:hypothetical protein